MQVAPIQRRLGVGGIPKAMYMYIHTYIHINAILNSIQYNKSTNTLVYCEIIIQTYKEFITNTHKAQYFTVTYCATH